MLFYICSPAHCVCSLRIPRLSLGYLRCVLVMFFTLYHNLFEKSTCVGQRRQNTEGKNEFHMRIFAPHH